MINDHALSAPYFNPTKIYVGIMDDLSSSYIISIYPNIIVLFLLINVILF